MLVSTHDSFCTPRDVVSEVYANNCGFTSLQRLAGMFLEKEIHIQDGPGDLIIDIAEWTGPILVLRQYSEITEAVTLTDVTDVYTTVYDGTVAVKITNGNPGGAVLSSCPIGTFITKDEDYTQAYTVLCADQVRVKEPPAKDVGFPFILNAKPGVQNTMRLHATTTDSPVDFKLRLHLEYRPMDGGELSLL